MRRVRQSSAIRSGRVSIGPLRMYWEQQGRGRPVLLLHAGFSTIAASFAELRGRLARERTTIAVEQQAHGHTADLDRPLRYERMAEDTAAFLRKRRLGPVDVFGWSDGGIVALGLAVRYPTLVRKVAICGAGYGPDAESPAFKRMLAGMKADNEHLQPFHDAYDRVAPDPSRWPVMIEKVKEMYRCFRGWPKQRLRKLRVPLMVMLGDQDFTRLEHAAELARMVPDGCLAVLPRSDHAAPLMRVDWVVAMLTDFFADKRPRKRAGKAKERG